VECCGRRYDTTGLELPPMPRDYFQHVVYRGGTGRALGGTEQMRLPAASFFCPSGTESWLEANAPDRLRTQTQIHHPPRLASASCERLNFFHPDRNADRPCLLETIPRPRGNMNLPAEICKTGWEAVLLVFCCKKITDVSEIRDDRARPR